ncbi:hypothetical protein GCM10025734_50120 [Kitasatospora paranensis]
MRQLAAGAEAVEDDEPAEDDDEDEDEDEDDEAGAAAGVDVADEPPATEPLEEDRLSVR